MKLLFSALLLALAVQRQEVEAAGGGTFYTYFDVGGLGPERWPGLQLEGNQCAGTNLVSGYGQSPVAIPEIAPDQCDTNTQNDYVFDGGDCTWDDLQYSIGNNGVKVEPKKDVFGKAACKFAGMRIPHLPFDYWDSIQFHIHSWSEHTIGGEYYNAELHSVHMIKSTVTTAATVWGTMISVGAENPVFDNYIRGWEAVAAETAAKCSGEPTTPVEQKPVEPTEPTTLPAEVEEMPMEEEAAMVDPEDAEAIMEQAGAGVRKLAEGKIGTGTRMLAEEQFEGQFGAKCRTLTHNPEPYLSSTPIAGTTPDIYRHLHNMNDSEGFPMYGTYTYKGGLTTPPCSEIVNWNLLDTPMEISAEQMTRLLNLIDCYHNADTCGYETVAKKLTADESAGLLTQSSTSRPPQPLQGRTITHRCYGGPDETKPDKSPEKPPMDDFVKPAPPEEPLNTKSAKCEKKWTEDRPSDPRADPTASPNLRVNAPVWNDFAGYWHGTYRAVDRDGNPIRERFASEKIAGEMPYAQTNVAVFKNITIDPTKYYEHTYFVFPPASDEFCSLPVPTGASNVLGNGKCGENGLVLHSERFGTATQEKDGSVQFAVSTGRLIATTGEATPISETSINFASSNDDVAYIETYNFIDKKKVKMSATGEKNIFADYFPYKDDPLAEVYNMQLSQTSMDTWVAANQAAQDAANPKRQLPVPMTKACLPDDTIRVSGDPCKDLDGALAQIDPLSNPSPYETDAQARAGFIAGIVILIVLILALAGYIWHMKQIEKQKERISHRFARRVAETIKIEGSHNMLTAEALKEEFDRIDKDHSGMLDKEELRIFVTSGKIGTISDSDFNALWAAIDVDGDGTVNFYPTSSTNTGKPLPSSSPESTTSTVISDSSEDSHGNTTVSSITQTMALDPARMAMDYPELAASLKHHPPMIERTLKCPAGAIGCQIDDSSTGPIIDDVLASSSMGGLLFPGDRILAVDGLDVRGLKCDRVTEIISEGRHEEREIRVLSIINIAENGCKGDAEEPKVGESSEDQGMEKLRARKKKLTTPAVSSVPAMPTPKPAPSKDAKPRPLHRRSIVAPAGKLGLVLRNTKDGPAIHTIKPTSPLEGKIFVGDRIIRLNSTDTAMLKAKELTKLMAGNSTQTREIVVLSAVNGAKDEKPEQEVQMKVIQTSPSSTPKPFVSGTNKAASITSATASLSTRSDTNDSGVTKSEAAEQPSVSVDHSLPPFRSTPSRRREGESFQQYLVRRRKDLSDIRAKKECHDDPACTDVKSRSSGGNRSSVPSFSTMKTSAEKFVQEGNQDAAIKQYEHLISCLEKRYKSNGSEVERDGDEITKVQQAGAQEEIIALCDVLRELYRAKGEKSKSVKCLRRKISTQRSLLKLKMEMM